MSSKLRACLTRIGALELSKLLGSQTMALLEMVNPEALSPSKLADLAISQVGPEQLLLTDAARCLLLSALSEKDAKRLSALLGLPNEKEPWERLQRQPFKKGCQETQALFAFFGLPVRAEDLPAHDNVTTTLLDCNYGLFHHQKLLYVNTIRTLDEVPHRALLHMPTGAGKTRTAMHILCHYFKWMVDGDGLIVWLAYSEELCDQAADEFSRAWSVMGDSPIALHRHYSSHQTPLNQITSGLLVAGLRSLYLKSLSEQTLFLALARKSRVIVIDEAHQATAPTYSHLLKLLTVMPATRLLGLSATPGRTWLDPAEDLRLATFFAKKKVTLTPDDGRHPLDYLVDEKYLARATYRRLPYTPPSTFSLTHKEQQELALGLDLPLSAAKRLGEDQLRNLLILRATLSEARTGAPLILFACSVRHAVLLASLLRACGIQANSLTSDTPSRLRRQLVDDYRAGRDLQVLTNFGVLTAGFDAPKTATVVIARPTRSVVLFSQMVGRAIRGPKAGGNPTCRVLTVVDDLPGFRSAADGFSFWDDIWTE